MIWAGWPFSCSSPPARVVAISLSLAVSRSARRRELAKTMVELCCSMRSTTCSSTCGQIEPLRPSSASSSVSTWSPSGAVMSSTGTTTLRSQRFSAGGATMSTGAWPPRNLATSSSGRTVALSPMRWAGFSRRASRRSRLTARWAPRLLPATACTSSRMTVSTPLRLSLRLGGEHQEQRLGRGDEDVGRPVLRQRRSWAVVSPDRTPTVRSGSLGSADPVCGVPDARERRPEVALHVDAERLERGDVQHPAPLRLLRQRVR